MQITIEHPPDGGAFLTVTGTFAEIQKVHTEVLALPFYVGMHLRKEQLILNTERSHVIELAHVVQDVGRKTGEPE